MKLKPIRSTLDFFLCLHLFMQINGPYIMIFLCNIFDLNCSINPKSYFLIGLFLLVIGQKVKSEGGSFPIILALFIEILYLFSISRMFPYFFHLLANLFYFIFIFSLYIFQRFEVPSKNIPYKVGYKTLILPNYEDISKNVAVFYPTEQTTEDVGWLPNEHFLFQNLNSNKLYQLFKGIFSFSLSFMKTIKLGVNLNAELAGLDKSDFNDKNKYSLVIFSHGLGGNRLCYSIFAKWLASQGVIVLCSEHPDKSPAKIKETLQIRYSLVKSILDSVYDKKTMNELFGRDIQINYENISISGHSFGGGTAFFTSLVDKRITGGVLALDPFVVPIDDQILNLEWKTPSLSISTETFNKAIDFSKNHEKLQNLFIANKSKNKNLFCYLKNSSHFQQGDIVCLFPRLLKLLNLIERKGIVDDQLEFNLKLIEVFHMEVICKGGDANIVKEKFWQYVKEKMKIKDKDAIKILL